MSEFEVHPLASIFPSMSDDQFADLVADIEQNGLIEKITLYQGKIIDGIHRYKALRKLDRTIQWSDYTGDDPVRFVVSKNLRRRHLNESQRAMIAASICNLKEGTPIGSRGNSETRSIDRVSISETQAGKMMKVGQATVTRAKKVRRKGAPEVIAAVENGELSVNAAAKIVDEPDKEKQKQKVKAKKAAPRKAKARSVTVISQASQLQSLSWSEATSESRQRFIHAVGVRALWQAMTQDQRNILVEIITSEINAQNAYVAQSVVLEDGIPEFLRRPRAGTGL